MKKSKKGVSLVALAVTIFIILTLLSAATISIIDTYNNSKKIEFANEINMIQLAVNSYYSANSKYPVSKSMKISKDSIDLYIDQFSGENYDSEGYTFSIINYDEAGLYSLKYGTGKNGISDIYVVSQDTGRVYYASGIKIGGKYYFTINNELNLILGNASSNQDTVVSEGIVFSQNIISGNQKQVTIKIPKKYSVSSIKAENTDLTLNSSDGNYNIYISTLDGTYTITINYTDDKENEKTVRKLIN